MFIDNVEDLIKEVLRLYRENHDLRTEVKSAWTTYEQCYKYSGKRIEQLNREIDKLKETIR